MDGAGAPGGGVGGTSRSREFGVEPGVRVEPAVAVGGAQVGADEPPSGTSREREVVDVDESAREGNPRAAGSARAQDHRELDRFCGAHASPAAVSQEWKEEESGAGIADAAGPALRTLDSWSRAMAGLRWRWDLPEAQIRAGRDL